MIDQNYNYILLFFTMYDTGNLNSRTQNKRNETRAILLYSNVTTAAADRFKQ